MIEIDFKDATVSVDYETPWDTVEVTNVFYKGININELLDENDLEVIYFAVCSAISEAEQQARIDYAT